MSETSNNAPTSLRDSGGSKVVRTTLAKAPRKLSKLSRGQTVSARRRQPPTTTVTDSRHHRKKSAALDGSDLPLVQQLSSLDKSYEILHLLGQGVSSQVFLAKHKTTHELVAVKMIPKNLLINNMDLAREISILKQMSHRYIIGLKDVLITEKYLQIIMEVAQGQELFEEICERRVFSEKDTKEIVHQLLEACDYLHKMGIVHRDLKPENIIFMEENGTKTLKIIDFGVARNFNITGGKGGLRVGTLGYKSPESLSTGSFTTKSDMWSIGVITYILLVGFPPFFSYSEYKDENMLLNAPFWSFFNDETDLLLTSIKEGLVDYSYQFWNNISSEAVDFVKSLLKVVPEERLSAEEALNHVWFKTTTTTTTTTATATTTVSKEILVEVVYLEQKPVVVDVIL